MLSNRAAAVAMLPHCAAAVTKLPHCAARYGRKTHQADLSNAGAIFHFLHDFC